MPFISIIVVTWNNENFIEQALASCIDTSFTNYEVIVVHNASTDCTGKLIQRAISENKDLFKVIENEQNEGLGGGRNIGMRHASGEYLMFLDGDDWYEPGAIRRIAELLHENDCDVLMFNHQRVWNDGSKRPNARSHLLVERKVSSPEEKRTIIPNFCVAWNKVYRRSFVEKSGATFPKGYYEDVKWSAELIIKAETCHVTSEIFINYRQRYGSILRSASRKHLAVIDRCRDLMTVLENEPRYAAAYGEVLYEYVHNIILGVVSKKRGRLPRSEKALYLQQASEFLAQWRKLIALEKPDHALSKVESTRSSTLLYKVVRELQRVVQQLHNGLYRQRRRIYRHVLCRLPISKNRVYLESYWGTQLDCNPLALAKALQEVGGFDIIVGFKNGIRLPEGFSCKTVRIGSLSYFHAVATANYMITNTNFDDAIQKREGATHIQTQHGTPIKTMGLDIRPYRPNEMNWNRFRDRCLRWDFVISSNAHSSAVWRRAMPYEYQVIEAGYPRNDILFSATPDQVAAIKNALNIHPNKKIALYAPTFRDSNRYGSFRPKISPAELKQALGDEYIVLIRSHYFSDGSALDTENGVIDVSGCLTTNKICLVSDLLITDYSSIMFDFACLKRPIVLFPYDYYEYANGRGVYFDIREQAPGAVAETSETLLDVLRTRDFESAENRARLERFNVKFCPWDDGRAAERVLQQIFGVRYVAEVAEAAKKKLIDPASRRAKVI